MNSKLSLLLALLLSASAHATPISQLPLGVASGVGANDPFPYVDLATGLNKRLKLSDVVNIPSITAALNAKAPIANPTFTGVANGAFSGSFAGNATTATALAANPVDCDPTAGEFAIGIAANGAAACAIPASSSGVTLDDFSATAPLVYDDTTGNYSITRQNLSVGAGLAVSAGSGTNAVLSALTVGIAAGYYLPSTADQTAWNAKESVLTFSSGLTRTVNAVVCDTANGSTKGCISSADWTTFNGKQSAGSYAVTTNNLSDLGSASTARTNLGLGTAATRADAYFLQSANNLSDLASASTARTNLGLGTYALKNSLVSGDIPNNAADTSGNAATATALAASPTQCSVGNHAMGITTAGNANCVADSATSPLTTKGDLYGFSTVGARLPVGTDGYTIVADSTQALGVKWAAPGGTGAATARFVLDGAVVPFTSISGPHYMTAALSLTAVNISLLNSGVSGSTVVQVNQYRAGALVVARTASISSSSSLPSGSAATLSGSMSLLAGDLVTVDVNSAADGASDLAVEWETSAATTGTVTYSLLTKTGNYTVTNSDDFLLFNCSTDCIVTFHAASSATVKDYAVKNIGTATLTVAFTGADTGDGETSIVIPPGGFPKGGLKMVPNGGSLWSVTSMF